MRDIVARLGKFTLLRLVSLVVTVVIAVYITVFIANWGGNLDEAYASSILSMTSL